MRPTIKMRNRRRGDVLTVRALIRHPMAISRRNKETGKYSQGHYIQEVDCLLNGELVMHADWGQGVSKNPYLSFRIHGVSKGDHLLLRWRDNQGGSDELEKEIG